MAIFLNEDITKLLWNKFVVIIGDSIQRGIYKDLVSLLQTNVYLTENNLKRKGEMSFKDDILIEGGRKEEMNNGINYREVRQYKTDYHIIRYYFVTRAYNKYMETILADFENDPQPDVVLMNSCLWDISRYGSHGMNSYKTSLEKTFCKMQSVLPPECLFIWNTALPVANKIRGGFLLPELNFLSETLRLDVMEGNFYAKELANAYGFDVLDLHFYFRHQLHRRVADGVHWNHHAHRHISNMILSHITEAWGLCVPRRIEAWKVPADRPTDQSRGDFHKDISLSAPAHGPRTRRNSSGDSPQFIDFDKVASPMIKSPSIPMPIQTVVSCNNGPQHPSQTYNGPVRSNQNRQAGRYNPYGGGGGCRQDWHEGGGDWGMQVQNQQPLYGLEERRKMRRAWEREEELRWLAFRYQ
ncbi:PC-esterase domain-containing protein 1A-like [Asterias rubens]|uniref:PC-esterase domain-containing protein 1A-like n=1 Tax=Asterias rubens TaxID=7604 RepID=UPI001455D9A1|nr:PC-esterase domain-containing protein 1A-like [Asterias rubens]